VPGVEREAIRLVLGNLAEAGTWVRSHGQECHYDGTDLLIGTPGDYIRAIPGEWVVRNPDSFWGFGHDVFQAETFAETYEPAPGPLVLPPDEFRAVQVVAAVLGVPVSASEPDGPATEATQTPEAIRELEARFREAVAKRGPLTVLPSDRWQERAEAAEAKLAEVCAAIGNFQAHYGHSAQPSFKVANDLAEGIRQVLDREPMRRGNEEGAGSWLS
jgi:hypothetical protein